MRAQFLSIALAACMCGAALARVSADAQSAAVPPAPIAVRSCSVFADGTFVVMAVGFENTGLSGITSVTWRAHIGSGWVDFADTVDLAAGATTKRTLRKRVRVPVVSVSMSPSIYESAWPASCSPIARTASDGTAWRDTSVDGEAEHMPQRLRDGDAPVPATFENPLHDPIGILGCKVNIDPARAHVIARRLGRGALSVRFKNLSPAVIDQVIFRAGYEATGIDFIFGGSFAPSVVISSDIGGGGITRLFRDLPDTLTDSYQSLDEPGVCTTVSVRYHDGTVWHNPTVDQTPL